MKVHIVLSYESNDGFVQASPWITKEEAKKEADRLMALETKHCEAEWTMDGNDFWVSQFHDWVSIKEEEIKDFKENE